MQTIIVSIIILLSALLSACSQNFNSALELGKIAVSGLPDADLSESQRLALPYASIYVKYGEHPRTYISLAKVSGDERLWATGDGVTLTTRHGQIIRSQGLTNSLGNVSSNSPSPFSIGLLNTQENETYFSQRDFPSLHLFGIQSQSTFSIGERTAITVAGAERQVTLVTELLTIQPLNFKVNNRYWVDNQSQKQIIWRSEQSIAPDLAPLRLEALLPYYDDL